MPVRGTTSERYFPRIDIGKMVADYFSIVYPDMQVVLNPKEKRLNTADDGSLTSFLF